MINKQFSYYVLFGKICNCITGQKETIYDCCYQQQKQNSIMNDYSGKAFFKINLGGGHGFSTRCNFKSVTSILCLKGKWNALQFAVSHSWFLNMTSCVFHPNNFKRKREKSQADEGMTVYGW